MFEIQLGLHSLIKNKKRTMTTSVLLLFLIAFIVSINIISFTNMSTKDLRREMNYGSWSHAFTNEDVSNKFEKIGTMYPLSDKIGSFDDAMFSLSRFSYYKGNAPRDASEAVVTVGAIDDLGLDYDLGSQFSVDGHQFELVGIILSYDFDWIPLDRVEYPTVITTGYKNETPLYFGEAKKLTKAYEVDDYVGVNTYSYPYIELGTDFMEIRNEETRRIV